MLQDTLQDTIRDSLTLSLEAQTLVVLQNHSTRLSVPTELPLWILDRICFLFLFFLLLVFIFALTKLPAP